MLKRKVGLEAIIVYKMLKAVAEALAGVLAIVALCGGAEALSASLAQILLDHVEHEWAMKAARLIEVAGTTRHLIIVAVLAFGDAVLSAIEGLALQAGRWWAPWLVVGATATLLPLEIAEIVHRVRWTKVLLLVLNLAVLIYLLAGAIREHREKARHAAAPPPPAP